jgi:hypothetical protein
VPALLPLLIPFRLFNAGRNRPAVAGEPRFDALSSLKLQQIPKRSQRRG